MHNASAWYMLSLRGGRAAEKEDDDMGTTIDTLTDAQIRALRDEAAAAGDEATVSDCDCALDGPSGTTAARRRIVEVIRNAEAQR